MGMMRLEREVCFQVCLFTLRQYVWHVLSSAVIRPNSDLSTSSDQVQSATYLTSPKITENIVERLPRLVA
jgi:hypothetical protein